MNRSEEMHVLENAVARIRANGNSRQSTKQLIGNSIRKKSTAPAEVLANLIETAEEIVDRVFDQKELQ